MSPVTRRPAPDSDTAPLETTSPVTFNVPAPLIVRALPPAPPHPAWSSAATAGVKRRLLTPPDADPLIVGFPPLVRTLANWSWSGRLAERLNRLPRGPRLETTWVSTVPSEKLQVTVKGPAPGLPYPAQPGAAYRRRLVPKIAVAACSAAVYVPPCCSLSAAASAAESTAACRSRRAA